MKKDRLKRSLRLMGVVAGVMGLALAAIPQNATAQMKDFGGIELTIATFPSTWEIRFRRGSRPGHGEDGRQAQVHRRPLG